MTQAADSSGSTERQVFKDAFTPGDLRSGAGAHAKENFLSGLAMVLAVVGTALIAAPSMHILGGWIALAGIISGLYAQLTSATTGERMVNVVAIGIAAVGFAFHLHHGGLF